ncbi:ATP-binding cassette, subfamily C, CydD [Pedococcus dokdonensis]|uniref:ATP-binding cassette, subfamily C, CydD n=1 Tax=Pedococcus dokdonensis TaxID=443156 RepID=A0A1H0TTJ4_9MICO|nr:thiol reductant ABC exporter subunit CydD [Pedococcus dokdonensis]SDP57284.1 ATP-binding cassette, subfamily C, CydD [Pedococcus dokdonensis]
MRPFDPAVLRAVPAARRPLIGLAVVGVAQGVATIATAFALAQLVVAAARREPVGDPAAYLLVVLAVRAVLSFVGETVAASAGTTVSGAVRAQLLGRWLAVPAEQRPSPARAVTLAAQGSTSIEPYVARFLPALVTAAVVPALAVVTLAVVDWPSALVVVLTLPLLPVFAALIGATTRDATDRRWGALADLSGHFLDVVRGLPTLVAYGRGERQVGVIGEVSQRHRRATMATLRLAFLSSAALELLATICVAIVAVTVGLRLSHGSLDLGTGLLAILLAPEAYWPIRRVGAEFHNAADGAAALSAALPQLATPQETAAPQETAHCPTPQLPSDAEAGEPGDWPPSSPGVCARGLGYTYPGSEHPVLHGVELTAATGLTVVTGPSGSGKSTLLELLAGLRTPTVGSVRGGTTHLVTQRPFLTVGSLRDNLLLGVRPLPDATVWRALRQVGLDGAVAAQPEGLQSPLGDDGRGLSAGQRARLVLARACLAEVDVVLLDEPTAHLDDESAAWAHRAIRELATRRCVVAVTHRPELLALADHHVDLAASEVTA